MCSVSDFGTDTYKFRRNSLKYHLQSVFLHTNEQLDATDMNKKFIFRDVPLDTFSKVTGVTYWSKV